MVASLPRMRLDFCITEEGKLTARHSGLDVAREQYTGSMVGLAHSLLLHDDLGVGVKLLIPHTAKVTVR